MSNNGCMPGENIVTAEDLETTLSYAVACSKTDFTLSSDD